MKDLVTLMTEYKVRIAAMSPEEIREMLRIQRESWAKSELQWAKDFEDGKILRD